jgi:cytochrome c553
MNEVAQEVNETDIPALARYMSRFKPSDQRTGR